MQNDSMAHVYQALNSAVAVTEADSEAVTEVDSVAEASEAEGVEVVEAA